MSIILTVVRKEFLQIIRDKRLLAPAILAPMVQLLLLGYAATTDIQSIPLVVCDQDHTSESREVVARFTNSGYFIVKDYVRSVHDIDRYIESGEAWFGLVLPADFSSDLLAHRTASLQIISDGSNANTATIGLSYANQILSAYSQNILASITDRSGQKVKIARIVPEIRVWYNPDLKSRNFMVPGVVAIVLMLVTMTLSSVSVVKEKEIGTMEQLIVTPMRSYHLIIGKLLPFVIIGAIDMSLVLAVARFWFEVPFRGSIALLYGLSGLFVLTTLGLGLFVSTISKTQQQAMMTAQFFFLMPSMFLSGFTFPIENMPVVVQYITYLIPLRYFITIIRGVFLKGIGIGELWHEVAALAIFGSVIFSLSVLRFRKRLG